MLLFADTESIMQPPPLCDPRSELQARKKRISTTALNETQYTPHSCSMKAANDLKYSANISP